MPQNYAFLNFGATQSASVAAQGSTATVVNSITVGTSATGLPATAVRIWNSGTAIAFVNFGTASVGVASAMPVPASVAPFVLRTGGVSGVYLQTTGTFTTTIYVTGGEGID